MESDSSQDKAAKSSINKINKGISELGRISKQMKLQQKIKAQTEIIEQLQFVSDSMRKAGASEHSIRLALRGMYEYLKVAYGQKLEKSADEIIKNPDSRYMQTTQAPYTVLSEVETQQVNWLWQKRIPLGKITILDGDPGLGKSLLSIFIAACVSTGNHMPDGEPVKQGKVILIAPEDAAEDTIKPRLDAAGGDPSQVLLLDNTDVLNIKDTKKIKISERPFSLAQDMDILEKVIKQNGSILVIIDPLMAVLGQNIDSSRDQDVREVLTPLAQVAERTGCAILIIRHLNKGSSDNILYRGSGSIGIIAVARIGLLVAHDPDDEQKRVFATIKNNLSKIAPNLSYQIAENEQGAPYIQWLGENHHTTATLLRPGTNMSFERQAIIKVLKEADNPLGAKEISELTGLKYELMRSILSRMQDAKDIIRPHRGKYTTPNHPSLIHKNTELSDDTTATTTTSATIATTATNSQMTLIQLKNKQIKFTSTSTRHLVFRRDGGVDDGRWGRLRRPGALHPPSELVITHAPSLPPSRSVCITTTCSTLAPTFPSSPLQQLTINRHTTIFPSFKNSTSSTHTSPLRRKSHTISQCKAD